MLLLIKSLVIRRRVSEVMLLVPMMTVCRRRQKYGLICEMRVFVALEVGVPILHNLVLLLLQVE